MNKSNKRRTGESLIGFGLVSNANIEKKRPNKKFAFEMSSFL